MKPLVVVAGVTGVGKTTVGTLLAERLRVPFADADALHPPANVAKMASGMPLEDDDRIPWLLRVGDVLAEAEATGMVMACSALRRRYRRTILSRAPAVNFVLLIGDRETVERRIAGRHHPFMPAELLNSQTALLEVLSRDEPGFVVGIDAPPEAIADQIATELMLRSVDGVASSQRTTDGQSPPPPARPLRESQG